MIHPPLPLVLGHPISRNNADALDMHPLRQQRLMYRNGKQFLILLPEHATLHSKYSINRAM